MKPLSFVAVPHCSGLTRVRVLSPAGNYRGTLLLDSKELAELRRVLTAGGAVLEQQASPAPT